MVHAQQRISSVALYPTNTSVVIKFSIEPGATCSGFTILHSLDSLNYDEVATEPGICGTSATSEEKSFTHFAPVFDQVNYYKVRLEPRVETSFSKSIFVNSPVQKGLYVYPNPHYESGEVLSLKIPEVENTKLSGGIFNAFGVLVKNLDVFTIGDRAEITISELENGFHSLRLKHESEIFTCKLIVLH
ncbi:hypothetical protein CNR22_12210 [Sphingobacteriaceae bacterium]|nr:hypothetical protein CNR22_12210 [Sphingobacteriaceae bacterium]